MSVAKTTISPPSSRINTILTPYEGKHISHQLIAIVNQKYSRQKSPAQQEYV
jgi:hypothetical protein